MVFWILLVVTQVLLSIDPRGESRQIKEIFTFTIGLILGCYAVTLFEYVRGLFIDGQNSSLVLQIVYYVLMAWGTFNWFIVISIIAKVREDMNKENKNK